MASEELQEPIEQKITSHESIDLEAIYNPITKGNIKEQMEIKSNVLDGNIVYKDGDLVEEGIGVQPELSNSVEPNQIITEKPESLDKCTVNLEEDIKEQIVVNYEETTSPPEEATTQEQQEKLNGETDNELYLTRLTEKLSPEVAEDETLASADSSISEQVEEKMDIEEDTKEDAHQNQVSETEVIDNSSSESHSVVALSDKTKNKEAEVQIGNASQYIEENVTEETEIPSSTKPVVEKVLDDDKENNDVLEEVQKEQVHQIEAAKENLADEKACPQETEDQGDISPAGASDEKISEEPSHENRAAELICEEIKQTEDTTEIATMDGNHIPSMDATPCDLPIANEEISKSNEESENISEEVKGTDISANTSPLISEEAMEKTDIKEDRKEEAHQNQIFEDNETGKDASQCVLAIDLSEKDCQNETEKAIEEEVTKEVNMNEVEGTSSGVPPVSEEVLEETKETTGDVDDVKMEQVHQNERECLAETEVQTRDVSEVVISEEIMTEEATENETPDMISEEVKPTANTIAMSKKDETSQNDNGENNPDTGLASSHQPIINEETNEKEEDDFEHVVEESTIDTAASRYVTPEIEMQDAEIKNSTSEIDDKDIEKIEDKDEKKSSQEVKPSESLDAPLKIEEMTPNNPVEEKLEEDDELKHKKTDDEKEAKSCSKTEERLDESKLSSSVQEVFAEIDTVETEIVKETEDDEKNFSHDEITLDSKETLNNDENTEETRGMNIAEKQDEKDDANGDELGEGDDKDDEINKEKIEEISEPIEPSNNTEAFIDTKIPREEAQIQSDDAVSVQLATSEEALQETPSESTTLSEMERESTGYNSERDNVGVENSHGDDQNKLPDRDDKEANAFEDQIEENAKISTNEHNEVDQKLEVEERSEENFFGNIKDETTPVIQNVENPSEKDDNIKSEIIEESQASIVDSKTECEKLGPDTESELQLKSLMSPMIEEDNTENSVAEGNPNDVVLPDSDELEPQVKTAETKSNEKDTIIKEPYSEHEKEPESTQVEGLTEVVEAPQKDDQNRTSDMSSEQDQLVTEEATLQDSLKVVSNDNENESKKPKPEEKIEAETLKNEEITERLPEVEEIPEAESTVEHVKTLNEPSISSIEQDQQRQESYGKPTENQTTDISVEESVANGVLISSKEQLDERSIDKEEEASQQEESIVAKTPKEETEEAEKLEESIENQIEEVPQITNPSDVNELELSQNENVAPQTEHLEVVKEFGDESKLIDTEKLAELENITHELTEQEDITRETQIGETEIITEEYQPDQEPDAKPTEPDQATDEVSALENPEVYATPNTSVEQIEETSVAEEENVILRDENEVVEMPKEETETIKGTDEKHIEEEIPEAEGTVEHVETLNEPSISSIEQDQQRQESDGKLTENQTTDDISVEESVANDVLISSKELDERSIDKEEEASQQEENIVAKTPKEETGEAEKSEESIEKQIEEVPQITNPSDISEVKLSQNENVAPEIEHLEVVKEFGDESKLIDTEKPAELENITHELTEQEDITRETQIGETEIITEEYQPDQESDAKPTEPDQAADEVYALENPKVYATLNTSVEQIGETSVAEEENVILRDENEVVEMPKEETETIKGTDEKHIEEEIPQIVHPSEITEPKLDETEPAQLEPEDLEIVSNEKIGDESELAEIDLKSAEMESASDELIKDESNANLSSSVAESEVLLQSTGEEAQGGIIDTEMPQEESSRGIEPVVEPCDKPIEEIHKTVDPKICDFEEQLKAVVAEMEVGPQKFVTGTESPELEKLTAESASVQEKADATTLIPGEGQTEGKEIANEEIGVPQTTCESVIISEENVAQGVETNEEPSDKDTVREISKCADAVIHDAEVPLKILSNEEEIDSEKLGTEIESSDLEKATEESALVEEKLDAFSMVSSKGQIEERGIADNESSVAPQKTVESVTVPEEKVSQEIETNELIDKHVVEQLHGKDILIDTFETPEEINLVQEDKVDEGQSTIYPAEQPDSKNVEPGMESSFLEKTIYGIDVNANLEETSETLIVEEKVAVNVINQTVNGSEHVPVVEETHAEEPKLIDEKISSDATVETANSTETNELQVQEEAPDTVVIEPENQTKEENLNQTAPEQEIPAIEKVEGEKEIPNVAFQEPVSGEISGDNDQKGVELNRQNALDQEAHGQNEREIDMIELLKTADQKVTIDESSEKTEEIIPNFPEQNKEAQEETNQSEGPEDRDFSFIVSSFLISKVLSEETQNEDNNTKQNDDASFIPKALDGEFIQENTTNRKEEIETVHEEIVYATSSREDILELQEQEKVENGEEKKEVNGEEDGVQQDYLPVSRFLMDKILWQEEKLNLQKEVGAIEETHKQLKDEGGVKVEEKVEENSNVEAAPEQTGEVSSSFSEVPRDFEKGETLIEKVDDTSACDGAMFIKEEENSDIVEVPKQEGEASHSSIEVATDFETESDVVKSNLERDDKSVLMLPEQEGEKGISPIEAVSDFKKENNSIEEKNETLVTKERISIAEKIQENNGEVATINEQGGKTYYPVEMGRDLEEEEKPEDEDKNLVGSDDIVLPERQVETAPSLIEEAELENREQSKDLVEEALVNAHEISELEKIIEENRSVVMPKEIEKINEVIVVEDALKDVKNVEEENYVLVEHEVNQFEESKEILEKEKVAHEIAEAEISNLEEKQANFLAIKGDQRDLVQQVEITESGMKNSSVSSKEIDQTASDIPRVPVAEVEAIDTILQDPLEIQRDLEPTEILKEQVGNETDYTSEKEQVKEVTGTVVERIQSKNQEKLTEVEATNVEKERDEIKDEEHDEDEEEEEDERHQEREAEIIGRDLTVKAEPRETETKPTQKKSHNILSGVGSKVKHSLAKVKKAITGKSKNVSPSAK